MSGMRDASSYLGHPFIANRHVVITSGIRRIYAEVERAVAMGRRSVAFEGPSNHGKTWTSKATQKTWISQHSEPVFWFTTKTSLDPKKCNPEAAVWANILRAVGFPSYAKMRVDQRFDSVLLRIRSACRASGTDRALMIIDEANGLLPEHLYFLKDLRNVLEGEDDSIDSGAPGSITLVYVLFGSEKMGDLNADLVNEGETTLHGRFFIHRESFCGLCCKEDLLELLAEMDNGAVLGHPLGSGVSTTQYFFPAAWQAGWRMEKEVDTLWRVMGQHFPENRDIDVGMGAATDVLKSFFEFLPQKDTPEFTGTEALWTEALRASKFVALVNNWRRS
ncbi:hypothetical protein [Variovorax rhizosphaerae]|uniref:AAA+ ATPase domain-containing protein n=1 Tax=Variovorax rhizosphaerae TaxID=1836200 RepID=A0ABU8WVN7_9BURK